MLVVFVFGSIIIVERVLGKGLEVFVGLLIRFVKLRKLLELFWDFVYLFISYIISFYIRCCLIISF